jgi:hypothetical protein
VKKLCYILFFVLSFPVYGQENQLLNSLKDFDNGSDQMKYVLNLKIDSIPEDGFSKLLKIKLNSELNSLGDIFSYYASGKELNLSKKEQSILESRTLFFAKWFIENKKYVIAKSSGGVAPASGIGLDTIAGKKVAVILMGGDCTITERDERSDYIYNLFSNKVRDLLNN